MGLQQLKDRLSQLKQLPIRPLKVLIEIYNTEQMIKEMEKKNGLQKTM